MKKFFLPLVLSVLIGLVCFNSAVAQKSSNPFAWSFTGGYGISANPASWVTISVDNWNKPYVCYVDFPSSLNVNVLSYSNNTWSQVGQAGFVSGLDVTMALDNLGIPYVAMCQSHFPLVNQASVMVFDGVNFDYLGNQYFSAGDTYHTSIAISPSGQPYVVYQDAAFDSKLSVMKFDGSAWVNVGPAGFSANYGRNPVIRISAANEPYVAFQDHANNLKATVMKYDGSAWAFVGNAGFSQGEMDSISLAFSPTGEPYVAFSDMVNSWKASVMKFDGSQWVNVGTPGFSSGAAGWTSLAFNYQGWPVVGYQDAGNSLKATVMAFDGNQWINAGQAGFSPGPATCTSLVSAPNGKLYIAFSDGANSAKLTVMEYSEYEGISQPAGPLFTLYPNPVSDVLKVRFSETGNSTKSIHIIDSGGKEVRSSFCNVNEYQVNVKDFAPGVYCIHINASGRSFYRKFIREN